MARQPTSSPTAHVKYLRGRAMMRDRSEAGMKEALALFEGATADDDRYAEAYVGVADAYFLLGDYGVMPRAEARAKGRVALDRALSINDGLAEAHNTLAEYLAGDYKYYEAEEEFKRAIHLNPNYSLAHHWYSICLLEMGEWEQSDRELRMALELDPLSLALTSNLVYAYARAGKFELADQQLARVRELDLSMMFVDQTAALLCESKGDFPGAIMNLKAAIARRRDRQWYFSALGYYYGMTGNLVEANKILEEIKERPDTDDEKPADLAFVYAGLGQIDEAFRQLNNAFDRRTLNFRSLRFSSLGQEMKRDPRFQTLFARANLHV